MLDKLCFINSLTLIQLRLPDRLRHLPAFVCTIAQNTYSTPSQLCSALLKYCSLNATGHVTDADRATSTVELSLHVYWSVLLSRRLTCTQYGHASSLQRQTIGLMQPQSFASRAVGQLFDVDQTALAPAKYSQHLNFRMNLTLQFV